MVLEKFLVFSSPYWSRKHEAMIFSFLDINNTRKISVVIPPHIKVLKHAPYVFPVKLVWKSGQETEYQYDSERPIVVRPVKHYEVLKTVMTQTDKSQYIISYRNDPTKLVIIRERTMKSDIISLYAPQLRERKVVNDLVIEEQGESVYLSPTEAEFHPTMMWEVNESNLDKFKEAARACEQGSRQYPIINTLSATATSLIYKALINISKKTIRVNNAITK